MIRKKHNARLLGRLYAEFFTRLDYLDTNRRRLIEETLREAR